MERTIARSLTIGKVLASGIIAFVILNALCILYFNIPLSQNSDDGITDFRSVPNTFYARGTEGFAWGKTNNEGYNNCFDYSEGSPVDILVIGSSQMEAFQVKQKESMASQLDKLLDGQMVYNIGSRVIPFRFVQIISMQPFKGISLQNI